MTIKFIVIYITDLFALLKQLTVVNKLNSIGVNISKTWKILNKLLGKNHDKSNPQIFNINNIQTEDKSKISNAFCSYFTDIGNQCAASIGPSSKQFNEYLIGNCSKSLFLHPTDKRDVIRIINELKPKNSCGHEWFIVKTCKRS